MLILFFNGYIGSNRTIRLSGLCGSISLKLCTQRIIYLFLCALWSQDEKKWRHGVGHGWILEREVDYNLIQFVHNHLLMNQLFYRKELHNITTCFLDAKKMISAKTKIETPPLYLLLAADMFGLISFRKLKP